MKIGFGCFGSNNRWKNRPDTGKRESGWRDRNRRLARGRGRWRIRAAASLRTIIWKPSAPARKGTPRRHETRRRRCQSGLSRTPTTQLRHSPNQSRTPSRQKQRSQNTQNPPSILLNNQTCHRKRPLVPHQTQKPRIPRQSTQRIKSTRRRRIRQRRRHANPPRANSSHHRQRKKQPRQSNALERTTPRLHRHTSSRSTRRILRQTRKRTERPSLRKTELAVLFDNARCRNEHFGNRYQVDYALAFSWNSRLHRRSARCDNTLP